MSYSSRVYRQRNAHTHDDAPKDAFFGKKHDQNKQKDNKPFFQTKLSVNEPGDQYEKEADTTANEVVNKQAPKQVAQRRKISNVQRLSTSAEDEKLATNDARMAKDKEIQEKPLQRSTNIEKEKMKGVQKKDNPAEDKEKEKMKGGQMKDDSMKKEEKLLKKSDPKEEEKKVQKMDDPKEEEKKKKPGQVQKKAESSNRSAPPGLSSKIEESAGKGKSLPAKTLNEMNSSFNKDFGNVQIHDDPDAAAMTSELDAQAFTHGKDIYFNKDKFSPENSQGKHLLAHELTHVVQQSGSKSEDSSKTGK